MKRTITITRKDHHFVCDPEAIIVQRQTQDWIEWINKSAVDCWISFVSTPFDEADFLVKANKTVETNSVRRNAEATNFVYDLAEDAKVQDPHGTAWHEFASRFAPTIFAAPAEVPADPQVIVH
jgi:hypothetical protein